MVDVEPRPRTQCHASSWLQSGPTCRVVGPAVIPAVDGNIAVTDAVALDPALGVVVALGPAIVAIVPVLMAAGLGCAGRVRLGLGCSGVAVADQSVVADQSALLGLWWEVVQNV